MKPFPLARAMLLLSALGCAADVGRVGGERPEPGAGAGGVASGGSGGPDRGGAGGGARGTGGEGGRAGQPIGPPDAALPRDASAAEARTATGDSSARDVGAGRDGAVADAAEGGPEAARPAPTSSQGPVAEGRIVHSQDFENDMDGMSPSPTSLPPSRYTRVDDPLGQRGKVLKLVWESGDNYRTSPNNKPRSCISNRGYEFPYGSKVSYAWGYMITSIDINATFAQHIRPGGPMWMLEGHDQGDLIVRCGGTTRLAKRLAPGRWYDFRVEVDYRSNGYVQVYIDGEKVYERRENLGFEGAKIGAAHWDGGIYNTELGISNNRTRTVYISNLSIGRK